MEGWWLCNGQNGTPDLRGRFFVGRDDTNTDYFTIGKTGGKSHVRLTVDQIPKHTHPDNGHSHSINLNTDSSGSHRHQYKDFFSLKDL